MSILGGTQNYGSSELSFGNIMPDVTLPWGAWSTGNPTKHRPLSGCVE